MERHQHGVVNFLSHLRQVWVYASHNKHDGFGRERPIFGDETISVASYRFQIFSRVNIEQQESCVIFLIFRGSFGHFYALSEFSMHLCA